MAFKKVGQVTIGRVAVSFFLTLTEPGTWYGTVPGTMSHVRVMDSNI